MVFHADHFVELLLLRHVVVDEPEPAIQQHRDGHAPLGHGVHVRGDDRDVELKAVRERGVELRVAGEDFGVKRGEGDVVVGQRGAGLVRKKRSADW